jgi:hypothetical protein
MILFQAMGYQRAISAGNKYTCLSGIGIEKTGKIDRRIK